MTIIIQNYAADGSDLGTHYPFYGTSEYPYNVSGYEFDPIAPISIQPAGDGLLLADFEVSMTTTANSPGLPSGTTKQNEPKGYYSRDFFAFNNKAPGSTGSLKLTRRQRTSADIDVRNFCNVQTHFP